MRKIDFKKPLLSIDGQETQSKLNEILSNVLATEVEVSEPIKFFDWAVRLFNEGFIEVDGSDEEKLKNLILYNKRMDVFTKGRLLEPFKIS